MIPGPPTSPSTESDKQPETTTPPLPKPESQTTQISPMLPDLLASSSLLPQTRSGKRFGKGAGESSKSCMQSPRPPTPSNSPTPERPRMPKPLLSPESIIQKWRDDVAAATGNDVKIKHVAGEEENTDKAPQLDTFSLLPKPEPKPEPEPAKPQPPLPPWPPFPGPGTALSRPNTADCPQAIGDPGIVDSEPNIGLGVWVGYDAAWLSSPRTPPPRTPPPLRPDSPASPPETRPNSPSAPRPSRKMIGLTNSCSGPPRELAGRRDYTDPYPQIPSPAASPSSYCPDGPRPGPYPSPPITPPPSNEICCPRSAGSGQDVKLGEGRDKSTPPKPNPNPNPSPGPPYGPPPYPPPNRPLPPLPKPKPQPQPPPKNDVGTGYSAGLRGGAGEDDLLDTESEDIELSELWDLLSRLQNRLNRYLAYQDPVGGSI